MPRTITWVHLSDLHSQTNRTGWDSDRILKSLLDDLKKVESDFDLHPDLFFFTGDVAFGQVGEKRGELLKDQFKEAQAFLEGVRTGFRTAIEPTNVFIVPGNHDTNRWRVTDDQTEWLDRQSDPHAIAEWMHKNDLQWQRFMERLTEYKNFLREAGYNHLLTNPNQLVYSTVRDFSGIQVGIAGLNSAWSCCREKEKGKVWLGGKWQLAKVMNSLHGVGFRVCLLHHPANWFVDSEDPFVKHELARDFSFCLHGHEHQGWVVPEADGHVRIAAASCYERSDKENGYCFVRVNFDDATAEVWLRRFDHHGACWMPRTLGEKTTPDGLWKVEKVKGISNTSDPDVATLSGPGATTPATAPPFTAALDLNTVIDLFREDLIERLIQKGTQLQNSGRFQDSVLNFEKAVALGGKNPDLWISLGFLYATLGITDKGIDVNRRAIESDPANFVPWFNLAVSLFQAARPPKEILEALESAQKLSEKQPPDPLNVAKLFIYKGHTLQRLTKFDEAIAVYRHALGLLSEMPRGRMFRGEAHKSLGDSFGHIGNKKEARKEYQKAIEEYDVPAFSVRQREAKETLERLG